MLDWTIPLWGSFAAFVAAAAAIGLCGTKLAGYADRFADRTGIGEAITGTIVLGLVTALPGLAASVFAALHGRPALAVSNAVGGIAFQTAILAIADLAYRKANLEHAAASAANMMQTVLLIFLLGLVLAGLTGPNVVVAHVHPASLLLIVSAGGGLWLVMRTRNEPMWEPRDTRETVEDVPEPGHQDENLTRLSVGLLVLAAITLVSGAVIAEAADNIVEHTPIPEVVVGGLFMAAATSLPELVTSIASVRRGALTLAVSDIVGGNFFDVLFVAAADLAFMHGSLYHAADIGTRELFLTTLTILLNVVLLAGLIYRQRSGPANIGLESVLMLLLYGGGFLVISLAM